MVTREDLEKKREQMRVVASEKKEAQALLDLAALVDAEEEHGFDSVRSLPFRGYVDGLPTLAIVRRASGAEYKKFLQQVRTAKTDAARVSAQLQFGEACLLYPPAGELRARVLEAFPGTFVVASTAAAHMAEAEDEAEKKD